MSMSRAEIYESVYNLCVVSRGEIKAIIYDGFRSMV